MIMKRNSTNWPDIETHQDKLTWSWSVSRQIDVIVKLISTIVVIVKRISTKWHDSEAYLDKCGENEAYLDNGQENKAHFEKLTW